MNITEIKSLNITAIFNESVQHSSIKKEVIFDAIKERRGSSEVVNSGIEAPGLLVVMLPEEKKEFVFEKNRLLVTDRSGLNVSDSEVVEDFFIIFDKALLSKESISSFGVNFDAIVQTEDSYNPTDLIGERFKTIKNISSTGVSLNFKKDAEVYILDIKPLKEKERLFAHMNIHFPRQITNKPDLKKILEEGYAEFSRLLNSL